MTLKPEPSLLLGGSLHFVHLTANSSQGLRKLYVPNNVPVVLMEQRCEVVL